MSRAEFEILVEECLKEIPGKYRRLVKNLAVIIEDESPAGQQLLGLYHGVPYAYRSPAIYGNLPPDVIVIYRKPLERISRNPEELKENIKETVLHEIGHYFGLKEHELRNIEAGQKRKKKKKE